MFSRVSHYFSEMGWSLRTLAVLTIIMVFVPLGLVLWAFATLGLGAPMWLLDSIAIHQVHVTLAVFPVLILILMLVAFLVSVALRASWGPRLVGVLAILYGVTSAIEKVAVPLILTRGTFPLTSILIVAPGIIIPTFLAVAFFAYLNGSSDARRWFRLDRA